jgi:hypothetical protein
VRHRAAVGVAGAYLLAAMEDALPQRPAELGAVLDELFGGPAAGTR